MSARLCFQVFFRVLFEGYLASGSAEVVGFSLVNRLMLRRFLVHFHFTNWVNCQLIFTSLPFLLLAIKFWFKPPQKRGVSNHGHGTESHRRSTKDWVQQNTHEGV